jgi:hypothetical protein
VGRWGPLGADGFDPRRRTSQQERQEKAQPSTMKASLLLHSPAFAHAAQSACASEQRDD